MTQTTEEKVSLKVLANLKNLFAKALIIQSQEDILCA